MSEHNTHATLSQFRIEGLNGRSTIDLRLEDNTLVLVGENGAGKSTVANLLYFTLTRQWSRAAAVDFSAVQVTASGSELSITRDEARALARGHGFGVGARRSGAVSSRLRHATFLLREAHQMGHALDEGLFEFVSREADVPRVWLRRAARDLGQLGLPGLTDQARAKDEAIATLRLGRFLYLPTYRRIELELESIFAGGEAREMAREIGHLRRHETGRFVELIEFGMEDVEQKIKGRLTQIKESVRSGLSNLTGDYLREVIWGIPDSPDASVIRASDDQTLKAMLERIDEAVLPSSDKARLERKVAEIRGGYTVGPKDSIVTHFLSKLISLYQAQHRDESDIRDFVERCNRYLVGKALVYDQTGYEVYVEQGAGADQRPRQLPLRALSSGEKQIVSLFAHLYLSGDESFFIIIDEPELSLSVPWQERLLPDIFATKRVGGLIAVTHSPFIWANEYDRYVRSLGDFLAT